MKPFFSDKGLKNLTYIDDNRLITSDHEVAETLNTFFDVVRTLNIQAPINCINTIGNIKDPVQAAILKYADHPSILKINEVITKTPFSFQNVSMSEIEIELKKINTTKGNTFKNIPAKLLKVKNDICCKPLCNIINNGINSSEFDNGLKSADVTPVFKTDVTDKKNYRPISVLPIVSKIFERVIQKQLASHINNFLSPYLCGYRKGFNAQHALFALLDKWITILDKKGYGGAVLMDLSKAFDTLNHELLIAKLHAYGFEYAALSLINSYLSNRWQRTKINTLLLD